MGWVKTKDFNTACEAAVAVEAAVGAAIVDTIASICTNSEQKSMAQVIATAIVIEKCNRARTEIDDTGQFDEAVGIVLAMLDALPLEPDGTRNLAALAEEYSPCPETVQ